MNYNELNKFTWGELSNLTWKELELEANKLVEKLRNDNRELPISAVEKLQEICAPVPEVTPKIKKGLTIAEACAIITTILTFRKEIHAIIIGNHEWMESVIEFFHSLVSS